MYDNGHEVVSVMALLIEGCRSWAMARMKRRKILEALSLNVADTGSAEVSYCRQVRPPLGGGEQFDPEDAATDSRSYFVSVLSRLATQSWTRGLGQAVSGQRHRLKQVAYGRLAGAE